MDSFFVFVFPPLFVLCDGGSDDHVDLSDQLLIIFLSACRPVCKSYESGGMGMGAMCGGCVGVGVARVEVPSGITYSDVIFIGVRLCDLD